MSKPNRRPASRLMRRQAAYGLAYITPGMLMGQLTPEQVIEQTMTYYNEQIVS